MVTKANLALVKKEIELLWENEWPDFVFALRYGVNGRHPPSQPRRRYRANDSKLIRPTVD
ncbi:MAG: hypothetical protein OXE78_00660 [Gammaproteobacteria bacterium]|nr:hypothetical protein [Gammaproteobacteria bacterium]MCY4358913.1 hypothetical protein [Gammaproteobacteria bacterium]